LGAAAPNFVDVLAGPRVKRGHKAGGGAQRVAGVELGGDDLHRNLCFGGVLGQEVGDGGDGTLVMEGVRFGRVIRRWGQRTAEVGVDLGAMVSETLGMGNMTWWPSFRGGGDPGVCVLVASIGVYTD